MSNCFSCFNFLWSVINRWTFGSKYPLYMTHSFLTTTFVSAFEIFSEIVISRLHISISVSVHLEIYVLIYGFVRNRFFWMFQVESTRDLFRRKSSLESGNNIPANESALQMQFSATVCSFHQRSLVTDSW